MPQRNSLFSIFAACLFALFPISGAQAQPLDMSSVKVPNSRLIVFRSYGIEALRHKECWGRHEGPYLIMRTSARLTKEVIESVEFQKVILLPAYLSARKLCGRFDRQNTFYLDIEFENMGQTYGQASLQIKGSKVLGFKFFRQGVPGPVPEGNDANVARFAQSLKVLNEGKFPEATAFPELFEGLDTEDAAIVAAYAKAGAGIPPALSMFNLREQKSQRRDGCKFDQGDMDALAERGSIAAMTILSECAFGNNEAYGSFDRAIRSLVYAWQGGRWGSGPSFVRTVGFPDERRSPSDAEAAMPGSNEITARLWKFRGPNRTLTFSEATEPEIVAAIQPYVGNSTAVASVDRLKARIRQAFGNEILKPICLQGRAALGAAQFGNGIGGQAAAEYRYENGTCTVLLFTSSNNKYFADRVDLGKCAERSCDFRVYVGCTYRGLMMADNCTDFGRGRVFRDGFVKLDEEGEAVEVVFE